MNLLGFEIIPVTVTSKISSKTYKISMTSLLRKRLR